MLIKRVRRKIYKAFHPAMGEVWMLHRVLPEDRRSKSAKQRELEITPEFLESQILKYKEHGYEFVAIDHVVDALNNTLSIHQYLQTYRRRPFICITLDDGYADNYYYAYPLFKQYNIPFIIYITTGFIDGIAPMWWYERMPEMLSWKQIKSLSQDSLCTIGAHTLTHPKLSQIEMPQVEEEIMESKLILEKRLGISILHFSYPHGDYIQRTFQILKDCGLLSSVLVGGGRVRIKQKLFEIPRVPIGCK